MEYILDTKYRVGTPKISISTKDKSISQTQDLERELEVLGYICTYRGKTGQTWELI